MKKVEFEIAEDLAEFVLKHYPNLFDYLKDTMRDKFLELLSKAAEIERKTNLKTNGR